MAGGTSAGSSGKSASGGSKNTTSGSTGSGAEGPGSGATAGGGSAGHVEMPPPIDASTGSAGSAGDASVCDASTLWAAINSQVIGACEEASPMLGPGESLSRRRGAVVLNDEGRVIDNTGLSGDKQQWLDQLGAQRWPCLAGQTIGYKCTVGG